MKRELFNKSTLRYMALAVFAVFAGIFSVSFFARANQVLTTATIDAKPVSRQILATGSVRAQNQATLSFEIGGKLVYLPFKEGETVYQGETIAQLDAYALQKQLQIAANNYQTAKSGADQVLENQQAGVIEGQQRTSLDTTNKNSYSGVPETTVIYDSVKRIVDSAGLVQDSAQLNVDLAKYALQLATLTSPIDGVILHEDVTTANVNITPLTSFVVADPKSMVFRADVRQQDINFINVGNSVVVTLGSALGKTFQGIVDKIYPQETALSNGELVYRADIKIDNLPNSEKIGQRGMALIKSNFSEKVILVPSWTVLSSSHVWVMSNGKPVLKVVKTGSSFDGQTEILSGLSDKDKVIINPRSLLAKLYSIL